MRRRWTTVCGRRDEALGTLAHVGLADRANERVRNLSYGEQKLLTVARVLATGAELLLLDEPASGLSAGALDNIMALLRADSAASRMERVSAGNSSGHWVYGGLAQ